MLICAPGHLLAGVGEVPLDALGGETLLDFPAGWGSRTILNDLSYCGHRLIPRGFPGHLAEPDISDSYLAR